MLSIQRPGIFFKLCIIFFLWSTSLCIAAQKAKYDSLQAALITHPKEDAGQLAILNDLSLIYSHSLINKLDSGIYFADKAIALAKKIMDKKALAKAYDNKVVNLLRKGDHKEADSILNISIAINTEMNNKEGLADNDMNASLLQGVQGNFDTCRFLANKALAFYKSTGNNTGIGNAISFIGYTYSYTGEKDKAVSFFVSADSAYQLAGNMMKAAYLLTDLSYEYSNNGKEKEAMRCLLRSEDYYIKDRNLEGLALTYSAMANVFSALNDNATEMKYYLKALSIHEQIKYNKNGTAGCNAAIGRILKDMDEYDNAFIYLNKGLLLAKEVNESEKGINGLLNMINAFNDIGGIYLEKKEYKKAHMYLDSALSVAKKLKNPVDLANTYDCIGDAWLAEGNNGAAIKNYQLSLNHSEEVKNDMYMSAALKSLGTAFRQASEKQLREINIDPTKKFQLAEMYLMRAYSLTKDKTYLLRNYRNALHELSNLYEQKGDQKKSLTYLKEYVKIQDTLIDSDKAKGITSQQIQFETEKKEQEIISLTKDKALKEQQLQNQKLIRNASIGGIILLLMLIAVIINRYKLKRFIAMDRLQQRISSDLHDDIGASLTSINILSQLSQQQKIDTTTRNEYLQKMNEQTTEVTNALRDIVWSINPKNDKLATILSRMKRYAAELLEAKNIDYSFESNIKSSDDIADADIRQNLYLIFKEALNNLAKYSGATKTIIVLNKEYNTLHLEIKDNGNGFDPAHVTKGNGINNMQRRAKLVKAIFQLSSLPGNGTNITVQIPL